MWIPVHFYLRYNYEQSTAASLIAVPYIVMIITAPIFGIIIDKFGKMMFFTNISCTFLVLAHLFLFSMNGVGRGYVEQNPQNPSEECNLCRKSIIALVLLGFNMTIFNITSNGSVITALVAEKARGSAYGINYAIQNLFLTFVPSYIAAINKNLHNGQDFYYTEKCFLIISIAALAVNLIMWLYDMRYMFGMLQQKYPIEFKAKLETKRLQ